jgi:hypothetical protein
MRKNSLNCHEIHHLFLIMGLDLGDLLAGEEAFFQLFHDIPHLFLY